MAFTSASFIVLTIASVLLYYIVPKKAQWCILLLFGIFRAGYISSEFIYKQF